MPPMTYKKLAAHLEAATGKEISYQRVQQIEASVLRRLRKLLEEDPVIIEYLKETVDASAHRIR
jgi:DNA-directed RNA polymerase sigma subunit (sigma70/sigma32)